MSNINNICDEDGLDYTLEKGKSAWIYVDRLSVRIERNDNDGVVVSVHPADAGSHDEKITIIVPGLSGK